MVGRVLRLAASVYRRHFARVVQGALVFLVLPAVLQAVLYEIFVRGEHASGTLISVIGVLLALISTIGVVMFAGFLDVVVDHDLRGRTPGSMPEVARRLPVFRLLVANVVLVAAVTVGLAVLVVPGLVALTWYCLVGPMLVSGGADSVTAGFRQSHALVRGHFGLVFAMVTVPLAFEHWLVHAIEVAIEDASYLVGFAVAFVIVLTVNATVGLVEVALATGLRDEDRR